MGFVEREMKALQDAMASKELGENYALYYIAAQALGWSLNPDHIKSPLELLAQKLEKSSGTGSDAEDCFQLSHPHSS